MVKKNKNNVTPWGSLFFMYSTLLHVFNIYRYRYGSRWFLQVDALAGTRSWDLGEVLGFFLISLPVADLVPFYYTIPVGWIHICKVVFLLILACWLTRWGVMLLISMRTICSLYACVPWPELSAPLTLVKHHTHRKVGLSLSLTHRQVRGGSPGPAICVSQHHWA